MKMPVTGAHATPSRAGSEVEIPSWTHVNSRLPEQALAQFRVYHSADELIIYANSSIDERMLRRIFVVFALFCTCICALSVWQGNVAAPPFLVLSIAIVAGALRAVRHRCGASDRLSVRRDSLFASQIRAAGQREVVFSLAWVRLMVEHPRAECRIHLRAHGESMEIGGFLNSEQRKRLAEQLKTFLDLAKARAVFTL